MTDIPAWAAASLDVDGLSVKPWRKLGPLTQEKGDPYWGSVVNEAWDERDLTPIAGFTCVDCPQRERMFKEVIREYTKDDSYERVVYHYTERCTECSRKMKRWQRGQTDAGHAQIASEMYEQGVSFVTLTMPNMIGDVFDNVRKFKRLVASFRKRFPEDVISGGKDFYEWTIHPDDRAWSNPIVQNVHMHGIWIMDFWNQKKMQEEWGHGIVHLKRAKSRDAVRYATKYAGKADVKGIRLKEGFGCLFGRAKRAMLEAYQVRQKDGL
jgi:hypothetical protein